MDRHTQMKIFIQGLVLFRLVQKVAAGRFRAYPKRISYESFSLNGPGSNKFEILGVHLRMPNYGT